MCSLERERHIQTECAASPPPIPPSTNQTGAEADKDGDRGTWVRALLLPLLAGVSTAGRALLRSVRKFPPLVPIGLFILVRPFRRAVRSQINILPILLQLKLFDLQRFESQDARLKAQDELDEVLSERFARFIGNMRGAFIKAAQVLGSLEPPPVRPAYVRKIEPMVDAAPGGRPWRQVRRQVDRELRALGWRGGLDEVFIEFDHDPIGTASVGQVHRAVLRDSGKVVAVKVQYPDARSLILNDLGNIHRILRVLGKKAEAKVVREYRSRISQEFNYTAEAQAMNTVADFFSVPGTHSLSNRIVVPHCMQDLSTKRLLVMDFIEGRSLRDALRTKVANLEGKPMIVRLPQLVALRHSTKKKLKTLLQAQAAQIFALGTFTADPHPGNIFLTPYHDRLGLLDFGCHKILNPTQRATLARLYIALAERDEDGIVAAAVEMGVRTEHMDRSVIVKFATHFFDHNLTPLSPPSFILQLNKVDRITSLPEEYMLVVRSSLLLRGLGAKLRAPQQVAQVWEGEARRYLRSAEQR